MRAPELRAKAWRWCPISARRRSSGESGKSGALFVEFAAMPALEADGEEGNKTEAYEEDADHENPAPMGMDPR
jgi:hypothetical protein